MFFKSLVEGCSHVVRGLSVSMISELSNMKRQSETITDLFRNDYRSLEKRLPINFKTIVIFSSNDNYRLRKRRRAFSFRPGSIRQKGY
jgi:hypothetical protein